MAKKSRVTVESDDEPGLLGIMMPETVDDDGVQRTSSIGADGREYPDPVPMVPPSGLVAPSDTLRLIRDFVHSERLRQLADEEGFDTPEEADDFDVGDEDLELTPYEKHFFPDPVIEKAAAAPPPEVSKPVASGDLGSSAPSAPDTSGKESLRSE